MKIFSPKAIGWFVVLTTIVLIVFDVYLWLDEVPGNTYSERIIEWASQCWWGVAGFIVAGFGALTGHWFLIRNKKDSYGEWFKKHWWRLLSLVLVFAFAAIAGGLWW